MKEQIRTDGARIMNAIKAVYHDVQVAPGEPIDWLKATELRTETMPP
jgi:hypothetical protein